MIGGRQWALDMFGTYGPRIREQVAAMVRAEHEASVEAQEASNHRSKAVYGQFYVGITERFESFAELPDVELVRPGAAPYRIPVINGIGLFPWRFAARPYDQVHRTPFAISDARIAATKLDTGPIQTTLDLDLPDPELTDEEKQYLLMRSLVNDPTVRTRRLVLVAINSSVEGLYSAEWGEVELRDNHTLAWVGFTENLLDQGQRGPVSTTPTWTFTSGEIPSRLPRPDDDAVDTRSDE